MPKFVDQATSQIREHAKGAIFALCFVAVTLAFFYYIAPLMGSQTNGGNYHQPNQRAR